MGYLIGTDEAGYGPNLGPLVISATVWEAPDGVAAENLFDRLRHVIAAKPSDVDGDAGPHVAMADSKALYTSGKGLRNLERRVWAGLGLLNHRPQSWRDVWRALAPRAIDRMQFIPWYADYDGPVPLDCDGAELAPLAERLNAGMAAAGVRLVAVRSRVIFADEFNELVERYRSKGEVLSRETIDLAAEMMESLPAGRVSVVCDKHGGRNHYGALLGQRFPEWLVEVRREGSRRSCYRFGPSDRRRIRLYGSGGVMPASRLGLHGLKVSS